MTEKIIDGYDKDTRMLIRPRREGAIIEIIGLDLKGNTHFTGIGFDVKHLEELRDTLNSIIEKGLV